VRPRKIGAVVALAGAVAIVAGYGASASSATSTARTATQAKPFVVLVTDVNQLNDHGFNALAYQGLLRANAKLGINGVVYQSPSAAQYIPNLATAARKGADLVISVGFDQAVAIAKVAKQFPKTHFAIIDVDQTTLAGKPKNVEGLIFKEQEVGYLAGYLAGLVEKAKGAHATIGSVGGQKQPPVDRYIAGYQAGAKKADPGVKLLNTYSQDWVDQAKCKQAALDQISAGATIVFQVGANEKETVEVETIELGTAVEKASVTEIETIDTALGEVTKAAGEFGAVQNRIQYTESNLEVYSQNLSSAVSGLKDVNMATEMTNFTKEQVLQQAGVAILAQANHLPEAVLKLLQ